ncbi:Hypothetical_protein [Hexamita inflata]|uniref:Hypothetical_protein n=1 Tax=Hexamita inflata TaxID=28002 RepID=A0AA86UQZ4_9EUKA|nr:Hypothetical protein HINF_LOCUS35088 [Hexamita inflata]
MGLDSSENVIFKVSNQISTSVLNGEQFTQNYFQLDLSQECQLNLLIPTPHFDSSVDNRIQFISFIFSQRIDTLKIHSTNTRQVSLTAINAIQLTKDQNTQTSHFTFPSE